MPLIADFLAGSILTLILPVAMLIALVVWYLLFIKRVPEPTVEDGAGAANPGPGATPTEAADPLARAPGGGTPPEASRPPGEI